jgi:single-strand DNA-binding protein
MFIQQRDFDRLPRPIPDSNDAESLTTRNNTAMTVLSLATKRTWKNRETGERESQTYGRTAEYAATLTKGAHLQILGEIQTREYTGKDGVKKSVSEIRVQRLSRLDKGRLDRAPKAESTEGAVA